MESGQAVCTCGRELYVPKVTVKCQMCAKVNPPFDITSDKWVIRFNFCDVFDMFCSAYLHKKESQL